MKISTTENISEIDFADPIQKSLVQSTQLVRGDAIKNAPYQSGTLRRSITVDNRQIKKGVGIVGTNVAYARVREYVNKKNPHKKFYMKRALQGNIDKIYQLFSKNLTDNIK